MEVLEALDARCKKEDLNRILIFHKKDVLICNISQTELNENRTSQKSTNEVALFDTSTSGTLIGLIYFLELLKESSIQIKPHLLTSYSVSRQIT